tara:strand:- start:24371 stop:24601 length:231 start_codon:yes stop_codon:yes gene_type:complete
MKFLEKDYHDYWEVNFLLPKIGKWEPKALTFDPTVTTEYGVRLPTFCTVAREKGVFWSFGLSVLGFGVRLTRQWSY